MTYSDFAFWMMLAFFFTHELDAVRHHEWRLMPVLNRLPDRVAAHLFVWLHVPLFFMILWFCAANTGSGFAVFLSAFSILHIGLHWIMHKQPANEFNNAGSWSIIIATGAFGLLHLVSLGV